MERHNGKNELNWSLASARFFCLSQMNEFNERRRSREERDAEATEKKNFHEIAVIPIMQRAFY